MDIVNELLQIGFSDYEARVYATLVSGNKLSASEICQLAGVPQGRVYGILTSLMDMGMCVMSPGTVKRFQALPPDETFAMLYNERRSRYEAEEARALKLARHLLELYEEEETNGNEFDSVSVYTSMSSIIKKVDYMTENSQFVHRSLCKPPYAVIQTMDDVEPKSVPFLAAVNRGVEFRSIYEIEEDEMEKFVYICQYFHDQGEKVKIMDKLPIKMIVMDSDAVMFTMYHKSMKKDKFTSMFIENSDIIFALTDLFDYYWSKATSFEDFVRNGYKLN